MKIELNTVYSLPTQKHEDDFLRQAKRQGFKWFGKRIATYEHYWRDEDYCIRVEFNSILQHSLKSDYEKSGLTLPIVNWQIGFVKLDMQLGQIYKARNGEIHMWLAGYDDHFTDDLKNRYDNLNDIIEVYPMDIKPIWKEKEPKYKVKGELTREQAEKLGLELCELVVEYEEE